jgi:DNA-binding transcriptional ArsR family regulator
MSLGDAPGRRQAALRAMAHPVRLRIMSLLTGASLTAAEVGRELGITHANASYHLRSLLAGGMIVLAGEEKIRGGIAKRYRYVAADDLAEQGTAAPHSEDQSRAMFVAIGNEMLRRTAEARLVARGTVLMVDAEVWVEPEIWRGIRDRLAQAARDLHDAAKPPRTPGTVRTSTTLALFPMLQADAPGDAK